MTTGNTPNLRMQRVERAIQRELAELIIKEIKDPRLELVSISHIDVSKDLSRAVIYVTTLSDDKADQKLSVSILNIASTHLRHCMATKSTWRKFPILHFKYDEALTRSQHLVELLNKIQKDQENKDPT